MLELYHSGTSVCAAKVRLVLEDKGLPWTGRYLDILVGEQFDPAYLKLNPKGVVPTLVHDGTVVRESTVICEYLDEVYAEPPLKPNDAAGRARMRLWTKLVDEELHPACAVITFVASHRHGVLKHGEDAARRFIEKSPDSDQRERRRAWLYQGYEAPGVAGALAIYDKTLALMEEALRDGPWLAGGEPSLADIGLAPYVNRLDMLSMAAMWAARPRVADWFRRVRMRPSFETAIFAHMPAEARRELVENGRVGGPELLRRMT
jgi:glutathione S-transferase